MMDYGDYEYGLLVKKSGTDCIGQLCQRKVARLPEWWHRYQVDVVWLTGPNTGHKLEESFGSLDALSPEEEAMYRLAHLGN